jgi:hypothetical protein
MLWEVGARFGFSSNELWDMKFSRLSFWHTGARKLYEAETNAAQSSDSQH